MNFAGLLVRSSTVAAMLVAVLAFAVTPVTQAFAQAAGTGPVNPAPASAAKQNSPSPASIDTTSKPDTAAKKGVAAKAIDRVKEVAKDASDIFSRVPCATPKSMKFEGSLPRVAKKLAAGEPITIIALGSSSTAGYGASTTAFSYPNRLAEQLRRKYPTADISIVNQGVGGEDTPQMMARIEKGVLALNPDLVIWQLGTNTVLKGGDIEGTAALIENGVNRIKAKGADVVLIDPQYAPAVTAKEAEASKMISVINKAAQVVKVGVFPRFAVMKSWHTDQAIPIDTFVIQDGLHMNDWGYACFAQLLGDTIIKTVGQVKAGVEVPSNIITYKPM